MEWKDDGGERERRRTYLVALPILVDGLLFRLWSVRTWRKAGNQCGDCWHTSSCSKQSIILQRLKFVHRHTVGGRHEYVVVSIEGCARSRTQRVQSDLHRRHRNSNSYHLSHVTGLGSGLLNIPYERVRGRFEVAQEYREAYK